MAPAAVAGLRRGTLTSNKDDADSSVSSSGGSSLGSTTSGTPLLTLETDPSSPPKPRYLRQQHHYSYQPPQEHSESNNHGENVVLGLPNILSGHSLHPNDPTLQHNDNDHDDDEYSVEDKLLQVVDQVEDEWEELAYDQLVPLEIKLALESNVFGWDHLSSNILGHVSFTLGAFGVVWFLMKFLWPQDGAMFTWRVILAVWAGGSSFRMVRRRKQVWLKAAYGSKQYLQLDRRQQIMETDHQVRNTWMARLRNKRSRRKQQQRLLKADNYFQKHHERRAERAHHLSTSLSQERLEQQPESLSPDSTASATTTTTVTTPISGSQRSLALSSAEATSPSFRYGLRKRRRKLSFSTDPVLLMQSVQDDQICFANGPIRRIPYCHGGGFGAAPFLLANPHWISVLRYLMPDVYVEISRRIHAPPHRLIHWAENNPVVAAYNTAHELEYNHFNCNEQQPQTQESNVKTTVPNMEWDVFLDPHLVHRVELVLRERRTFLLSALPELPTVKPMQRCLETDPNLQSQLSLHQKHVVNYYEQELRKRVQHLVDEMLIAHGNLAQLTMEQTGLFKYYNYSRVKRTRRTLGGGIFARQWMAVYAEALRVGMMQQDNRSRSTSPNATPIKSNSTRKEEAVDGVSPPASSSPSSPEPMHSHLLQGALSSCPNTTIAESVQIIQSIIKNSHDVDDEQSPFGLYLDVKSRHVPPQVWACVVDLLRESGVRVQGVGSFVGDELRSLSMHTVEPVQEVLYFHSAGDLQQACHSKRIRYGDCVFFNAGSLLYTHVSQFQLTGLKGVCSAMFQQFDAEATKQMYRMQPYALPSRKHENMYSTIQDYKRRYNLSIGLYVQEFAIDEAAANILVQLVNDHSDIYDLGLSWGGVNGITLRGIQPGRFTDTSGFWNQRHLGNLWDPELRPPV